MEKRCIRLLGVTVFLGILSLYASRGTVLSGGEKTQPQNTEGLNSIEISEDTESESGELFMFETEKDSESESDKTMFYQNTDFLKNVLFRDSFIDEAGPLVYRGVREFSEEVNGEFSPVVPEGCPLPEELVTEMEEAFYHSASSALRNSESCFYDEKIEELGGEDYRLKVEDAYVLFPRISQHREQIEDENDAYRWIAQLYLKSENCIDIFHLGLVDGRDYYVFSYRSGGSSRNIWMYLMERSGDEFHEVDYFGSTSYGRGTVVKYGEKFYYILLQDNDHLKDYDGVTIYCLDDNIREHNLTIRYLPEKYFWSTLYQGYDIEYSVKEEVDLYVEKIKEEFTPGTYLGDGMQVYYGDEANAPAVEIKPSLAHPEDMAYLVDIANCGRPVYICKGLTCPNCCEQYLIFMVYSRPLYGTDIEEPDKEIHADGIVQTWFKEIQGKVYTCQIYHLTDYNYIFRMALLEEDIFTVVRTEMIVPQRKFVEEGGFYWGM